jgi:short-subunit dehydrogenase
VPPLVTQDVGHVLNTASIAALGAFGNVGPYNASKHAVLAISETMHHELAARSSNVGVTVVCPGFVSTSIYESERNWPERLGELPESTDPEVMAMQAFVNELVPSGVPPSAVADLVVDAIRTRRFLVTTELEMARQAVSIRRDEVEGAAPFNPLV